MIIILFGPPGVGKGTQAKLLSTELHLKHISTGDMLREAAGAGTELGKRAKVLMDAGQLVPDDLMIGIIRDVFQSGKSKQGYILDGFPRTVPQAIALTKLLDELHLCVDAVINMDIDERAVIDRLGKRLTCRSCGRIYNLGIDHLGDPSRCPKCGGELYQRDDDKPETVKKRLQVYAQSTAPVKEYYAKSGLLKNVDAAGSVEEVRRHITNTIPKR